MRSKDRVAFMVPILARLAPGLGAKVLLEPEFGYVGLIQFPNGNRSYFWDNKFNLNSVSSAKIAQDKGYTHYFLKAQGYRVPPTGTFFRETFRRRVKSARGGTAARRFAREIGWPVYLKPLRRSQGDGILLARNAKEFEPALRRIFVDERAILVQAAVPGRDYRIIVLDGEVLSAYERIPLTVVGDGRSTIDRLLGRLQKRFDSEGRDTRIPVRDPRIGTSLRRARLRRTSVLAEGAALRLLDVANLSLGGTTHEITGALDPSFARLAARVAADMDLRFAGVDLIAPDATAPLTEYAILEVNSAPGLDHYGSFGPGHEAHVDALYLKVLEAVERGPVLRSEPARS